MLCYVMLCYVMLCYVMLCYVMLHNITYYWQRNDRCNIYRSTDARKKFLAKKKEVMDWLLWISVTLVMVLSAGGGEEKAVRCRVRCAWGKFNELMRILTMSGSSLKVKGKIYKACMQSVMMIYSSETWAMEG